MPFRKLVENLENYPTEKHIIGCCYLYPYSMLRWIRGLVIQAGTMRVLSGITSKGDFDIPTSGCRRYWTFHATQGP
jgi:hypothetical protein